MSEVVGDDGEFSEDQRPRMAALAFIAAIEAGSDELAGSTVEGDVHLESITRGQRLDLRGATFTGHVHFGDARFKSSVDLSVCAFLGGLSLLGARIEGSLKLSGARVGPVRSNEDGPEGGQGLEDGERGGLVLRNIKVREDLDAAGLRVEAGCDLSGAKIDGQLILDGSKLGGLDLQSARVRDLSCGVLEGDEGEFAGFEVEQEAWLSAIEVKRFIDFRGATIGRDLILQDAKLGDLYCGPAEVPLPPRGGRLHVQGDLSLHGAVVRGQVELGGAKIEGDLNMQRSEVHQDVKAGNNLAVGKAALLAGAEIRGDLDLGGATVAKALNLRGAKVEGEVNCVGRNGQDCRFESIDLLGSRIDTLRFDGRACGHRVTSFKGAEIELLAILEQVPISPELDGLHFKNLELPEPLPGPNFKSRKKRKYVDFLDRSKPFQKSDYLHVERWLRDRGEDIAANKVYRHMRRRDRKTGTGRTLLRWPLRMLELVLLEKLVGYGTQPERLAGILALMIALCSILFSSPESVERRVVITPEDVVLHRVEKAAGSHPPPGEWSASRAFRLAIKISLPLISIMDSDDWEPSAEDIPMPSRIGRVALPSVTYRGFAATVSLLGWIFFPLFLPGVVKLFRKA